MIFPEPQCVRGAVLGPQLDAEHPSSVAVIADTPGIKLTHYRADTPEGVLDRLEIHAPPPATDMPVVHEPTLYAGPYFAHFGHMIAECIHRLWAVDHWPHLKEARIAFQAHALPARPPWFDAVIDLCGIDPARVMLVNTPTRFETLYVPAQGRALGGALLLPDYLDLFPLSDIPPPAAPAPRLYVSRARHIRSGTYLGESLIERLLAEAGFTIVHPQDMPMRDVAGLMRAAEMIVFAEGSAIHNLELCGQVDARVMVIARRDGAKRRFGALLDSLAREVRFFSAAQVAASLEWDRARSVPRAGVACSILPIDRLVDALSDFIGRPLPQPSADAIRDARASDLLRYLLDPRAGVNATDAEIGRALRVLRADQGIAALRDALTG